MELALLFVKEGERLANEGSLLQAIVSLKNACYCRNMDPAYIEQLDQVIDTLSRKHRFGK